MKRNKTLKALLSLALAAMLCIGGMTTAFAAPGPSANDDVRIKKVLEMPDGTGIPASGFSFDFTFTAKEYNNQPASSTIVNGAAMPTPTTISIGFDNTDTAVTPAPKPGVTTYEKESGKIFDGTAWTAPGVYTYTVQETPTTYTNAATGETMTDSTAKYEVTAYVINNATNTGFEVNSITTKPIDPTGAVGSKIDVTPGSDNGFVFTNVYEKTAGGTDPLTQAALTISKTVAVDANADYGKFFPFVINTTPASTQTGTVSYKAYLIEGGAIVAPTTANGTLTTNTDANGDTYIEVTAGTALNVNLKHGQSLGFVDMLVGSSFDVTESAVTNYKGDIALTVNGVSSTVNGTGFGAAVTTGTQSIGANTNAAAFTNTVDATAITPTGITVNDLPFIGMMILAIGGFAAYVVIKSRKKTAAENE